MCAGALVQARVRRLVYGARDERAGAVESVFRICDQSSLNHRMELTAGVLEPECRELMQAFFRARRLRREEGRGNE
jgi:tRNA(adenine34) deaminase